MYDNDTGNLPAPTNQEADSTAPPEDLGVPAFPPPDPAETLPIRLAAETIMKTIAGFDDTIDAEALAAQLSCSMNSEGIFSTQNSEALLITQVKVLDSVFNNVLQHIYTQDTQYEKGSGDLTKLLLALQSQRQCRQNLETLRRLEGEKDIKHQRFSRI